MFEWNSVKDWLLYGFHKSAQLFYARQKRNVLLNVNTKADTKDLVDEINTASVQYSHF